MPRIKLTAARVAVLRARWAKLSRWRRIEFLHAEAERYDMTPRGMRMALSGETWKNGAPPTARRKG